MVCDSHDPAPGVDCVALRMGRGFVGTAFDIDSLKTMPRPAFIWTTFLDFLGLRPWVSLQLCHDEILRTKVQSCIISLASDTLV